MIYIEQYRAPDACYDTLNQVPPDILMIAQLYEAAAGVETPIGNVDLVNYAVERMGACTTYVARQLGGRGIIGAALYERLDLGRRAPKNTSWLEALAVDRGCRGQGIGRVLIEHLVRVATGDRREAIRLMARPNERTIRFYINNSFGIETDGRLPVMRRDI